MARYNKSTPLGEESSIYDDIPFIEERKIPPPSYSPEKLLTPTSWDESPSKLMTSDQAKTFWDDCSAPTSPIYREQEPAHVRSFIKLINTEPFGKKQEDAINYLFLRYPLLRLRHELATRACFTLEVAQWSIIHMEHVLEQYPELEWSVETLRTVMDKLEISYFIEKIDLIKEIFIRYEANGKLYYGSPLAVATFCGAEDIAEQLAALYPDMSPTLHYLPE